MKTEPVEPVVTPPSEPAQPGKRSGQWVKGQSGSPEHLFRPGHVSVHARPMGLMRYIRAATRDGQELAEFMLAVMRADVDSLTPEWLKAIIEMPTKGILREPKAIAKTLNDARGLEKFRRHPSVFVTMSMRMSAARWLADRGYGKVLQSIEHLMPSDSAVRPRIDLAQLNAHEFDTLRRLSEKVKPVLPSGGNPETGNGAR
jgi:hypothetical protein